MSTVVSAVVAEWNADSLIILLPEDVAGRTWQEDPRSGVLLRKGGWVGGWPVRYVLDRLVLEQVSSPASHLLPNVVRFSRFLSVTCVSCLAVGR